MSKNTDRGLIHFWPNLRSEPATATTGFTWGKIASESNIIQELSSQYSISDLGLLPTDIIAERWLVSDDRALGGHVLDNTGSKNQPFWQVLEESGEALLGHEHFSELGPFLGCVMKQLDTHQEPTKGSLSVQVHPKPGHPTRPAKPEMWQGTGQIYLGWEHDVTVEEINQHYESGTLEQLMNAIDLKPEQLVLVRGGMIHAIRYNTFTAEWSMAPGSADILKGNLKDATVSPYDRTDGKTPRPGKEDLAATVALLSEYPDGFLATSPESIVTQPQLISQKTNRHQLTALFRTPEVWVNQLELESDFQLDLAGRGLPFFIKSGQVTVHYPGGSSTITAGSEFFIPAYMKSVTFEAVVPSLVQYWFKPLKSQLEH